MLFGLFGNQDVQGGLRLLYECVRLFPFLLLLFRRSFDDDGI